jgi:hypothetical protein
MEPSELNEKPKFNWQRLLITVGIVIVTAGAIGGTTWYVMNQQAKNDKANTDKQVSDLQKQVADLQKTQTSTTTTTPSTTTTATDPTAGWKTYTNTKYGYTLKYPSDWSITTLGNADPSTFPAPNFAGPCDTSSGQISATAQCANLVAGEYDNASALASYKPTTNGQQILSSANQTIAGLTFLVTDFIQNINYPNEMKARRQYLVAHNGKVFEFQADETKQSGPVASISNWKNTATFTTIIQSLKFN